MIALFLVGAEGSGHHMFRSILSPVISKNWFSFEGGWHGDLMAAWQADRLFSAAERHREDKCLDSFREKVSALKARGVTHIYENASFPFNNPRDSLRRPDLIHFDQVASKFLDIRYLVIYRDPVRMVNSAIQRGFTDNPYLQCRIVEDNLIYIKSQMGTIPSHKQRTIQFEQLVAAPDAYCAPLAEWWHLDPSTLAEGFNQIRPQGHTRQMDPAVNNVAKRYFSPQRTAQWLDFFSANALGETRQQRAQR